MNDLLLGLLIAQGFSTNNTGAAEARKKQESEKARRALHNYSIDLSKLNDPVGVVNYMVKTNTITEVTIWKNE